jgi:hypothetical protein
MLPVTRAACPEHVKMTRQITATGHPSPSRRNQVDNVTLKRGT